MMPQAANSRCASDLSPTPKSVLDCSSGKRSISPSKSPSVTARFKASWGRRLPALRRRALDIFVRRNESRTSNESDSEPKVIAGAVSMIFHSLDFDFAMGTGAAHVAMLLELQWWQAGSLSLLLPPHPPRSPAAASPIRGRFLAGPSSAVFMGGGDTPMWQSSEEKSATPVRSGIRWSGTDTVRSPMLLRDQPLLLMPLAFLASCLAGGVMQGWLHVLHSHKPVAVEVQPFNDQS